MKPMIRWRVVHGVWRIKLPNHALVVTQRADYPRPFPETVITRYLDNLLAELPARKDLHEPIPRAN